MERRQMQNNWAVKISLLLITAVFATAAENTKENQTTTSVFSLRKITAQQGKEYLSQLNIGKTVSIIKQTNALVITADSTNLFYARNLLSVVDSEKHYVIEKLGPAPEQMPDLAAVNSGLDNIKAGKFSDPPVSGRVDAAIYDSYNGQLIIVAPDQEVQKIISAVKASQSAKTAATEPKEIVAAKPVQENGSKKADANSPSHADSNTPSLKEIDKAIESSEKEGEPNAFLNDVVGEMLEQKNKEEQARKEAQKQAELAAQSERSTADDEGPAVGQDNEQENSKSVTVELPRSDYGVEAAKNVDPNAYRPEDIPNGDQLIQIDLPETIQISTLLELVGDALHLNYLYDPAKISGQVSVKMRERLTVRELYALTESVLRFSGYAMSRRGNLVTVVPVAEMQTIDPALKMNSSGIKPGDVIVTSVFRLNYISIENAINLLNNMRLGMTSTGQSNVFPLYESNSIIVTEFAFRMNRIEKLLKLVDQPGTPRQFRYRQLKFTLASAIVPKIQSLAQQLGPDTLNIQTGTVATTQANRMRSPRTPTPQPIQQPSAGSNTKAGVYLDYDERTNRILMVGGDEELNLIEQLLNTFDVPQQDLRNIKEYQVQYVDAQQIVETLNTLGIISGYQSPSAFTSGSVRSSQMSGQQPGGVGQAGGQQGTEAPVEQPQIAVLESTNSMLVNATPEQHAAIQAIIAHVDREPAELSIPYTIYPLEYQDPTELQKVLSELVEKTLKDKEGKVQATLRRDEDIAIVADEKAFSLVVYATKKNQEWIGALIKQLDRKRPQVLIDVTLVEITKQDDFDYDLRMVGAFPNHNTANQQVTDKLITADPAANLKEWKTNSEVGGQFFYSDKHVQALLTAVQTKSYGRVLAKPKILVNDNEEGKITTSTTTYVAESTTQIPDNGDAITTTKFNPYDAKIELSIIPHISEGDLLLLEVDLTREDFVETPASKRTENPAPPNKVASTAKSIVTVPDGSTIILGGLVKLTQTKGGSKVPILGDLPLVGMLFKSISNSDGGSKLYIFVKAYVLRPAERTGGLPQLEAISRQNREAFEKAEKKFQGLQDIPGLKPKVIDPMHVLDEE